jgi:hypothetical protein
LNCSTFSWPVLQLEPKEVIVVVPVMVRKNCGRPLHKSVVAALATEDAPPPTCASQL